MNDSRQTSADNNKSSIVKQRLIWLGIILAILAVIEIGYLIMRIANPQPF